MSSNYQDLRVWQQAMALAAWAYRATQDFPKQELYGLVSQLRTAAVSVASNIAEGKVTARTATV
jgi:four helix bundle protein